MKLLRTYRLAAHALRRNVLRSVLTTLGIVIGISAVIAMMEIGQGSAKAIARQLKYLRELDRNGELFGAQELDDLGELLGRTPASLDEGRAALVDAVHDGTVAFEDYVAYHWRRLRRDDHLMRHASGALYERGWPDLR